MGWRERGTMTEDDPIFMIYQINKPFPREVHQEEGGKLHIDSDGSLMYLMQLPRLTKQELSAFHTGFKTYGYLETGTTPPVAFWIWNWNKPLCPSDANFNAVIADKTGVKEYLKEADSGGVKNTIIFLLLDRQILRGIKIIALEPDAVLAFQATIRKQLELNRPFADFQSALNSMYHFTTDELYTMSRQFHK